MSQNYISEPRTANVPITRIQGDSFYYAFDVKWCNPVNFQKYAVCLSGYTSAEMQVRQYDYASSPVVLSFSSTAVSGNTIDISDSTYGRIIVQGEPITLSVGRYYYDLSMSNSSGITETIISGTFNVVHQISN